MAEQSAGSRISSDAAEWIVAIVSAVLVLALLVFLLSEALTQTGRLPDISLAVTEVVPTAHGYNALVSVTNQGSATAAEVELAGILGDEESRALLDYSPAQSVRQVSLIFTHAATPEEIQLRVLGYTDP